MFHNLPTIPGPPVFAKECRLDQDNLASTQTEFLKSEKAGIVHQSLSPWSSPLHMVPKSYGPWRPYGDLCHFSTVTIPDKYPLPPVSVFSARISGSKFLSKLDLQKSYFQVPMRPTNNPKTPIISPFGLFIWPPECRSDLSEDEGPDLW